MKTGKAVLLLACCLAGSFPHPGSAARLLLAADEGGCSARQKAVVAFGKTDEYPSGAGDELIVWGTQVNYATGKVKAYTKYPANGTCKDGPLAVGVEISDATLDNLPGPEAVSEQPPPFCKDDPTKPGCFMPNDQIWLKFAPKALRSISPFEDMQLNWEPMGHMPPGTYDVPHFDFHFYLVPKADVMNISTGPCMGLSPDDFTAANEPIPEQCFPEGYFNALAVAPMMGNHYLGAESPEIVAMMSGQNGVAAWNQTWIYGGFAGEITYLEPMVKRSYLMAKPDECWDIPGLPEEWAISGYKPSTYCVVSTDTGVRVEVRDFEWYDAGCMDMGRMANASYGMPPPGSPPLPPQCKLPAP